MSGSVSQLALQLLALPLLALPTVANIKDKCQAHSDGASVSRGSKAARDSEKQQETATNNKEHSKLRDSDTDKRLQIADAIFVATNYLGVHSGRIQHRRRSKFRGRTTD